MLWVLEAGAEEKRASISRHAVVIRSCSQTRAGRQGREAAGQPGRNDPQIHLPDPCQHGSPDEAIGGVMRASSDSLVAVGARIVLGIRTVRFEH